MSESEAMKRLDAILEYVDELEIRDARECAEGDKSGQYWSTIIGLNLGDIEGAMSLIEVCTGEDEATDKALCEAIIEGLKLRASHAVRVDKIKEALK